VYTNGADPRGDEVKRIAVWNYFTRISIAWLLTCTPTLGEDNNNLPLVPLPSVVDYTRGAGWGVALGAAAGYGTAYAGSDEYGFGIGLAGAIQWRTGNHLFSLEDLSLGWTSRIKDVWLVHLDASYGGGRESGDSDDGRLDGLEDRDDHLVGVVAIKRSLGSEWRNWIGGNVVAGDSDFGMQGRIAAGHRFGSKLDGTGTEVIVFSTFGNSHSNNRDFGVMASESMTSGLPETNLDGGFRSIGLSLIDRRYLTEHIQFTAQGGIQLYSSDIQDSPIARQNYGAGIGLSLVYQF
jgi:outer membrane scaffolding protein for murein synthesis (MipA/OmpV family)